MKLGTLSPHPCQAFNCPLNRGNSIDMLAMAQALLDRQLENMLPIYTGGASVSRAMLTWFEDHPQFGYLLVPDEDGAGQDWTQAVSTAVKSGGGLFSISRPPAGLDPDEALGRGWWPEGL